MLACDERVSSLRFARPGGRTLNHVTVPRSLGATSASWVCPTAVVLPVPATKSAMSRKYPPRSNAKQQLLTNAEFLASLSSLLSDNQGSIYLTQKRMPEQFASTSLASTVRDALSSSDAEGDVTSSEDYEVLFRATNGKDQKISTRVNFQGLGVFMDSYSELCRSGMGAGLKKRDRKKGKKSGK